MLIALIVKGTLALFVAFVSLVAFLGLFEFFRMAIPDRRNESLPVSLAGALLTPIPLLAPQYLIPAMTTLFLGAALLLLFRFTDIRRAAGEWASIVAGLIYLPMLLSQLILLRAEPHGAYWILLMLSIVMAGDSAAYYFGSTFGRHKLYPAVSPNKSIEGAIAGISGSIAGAFIVKLTFFSQLDPLDCMVTAVILGVAGQFGDLFESLLKRSYGVKDSGVMVPGHGGILDRLDSILFAAPAAWWYAHFIFSRG